MPTSRLDQRSDQSEFSTSLSLLERVKAHDNDAWQCLTESYGPLIYHWCRKAGMNPDDAADLIQDVFRSLVMRIEAFRKTKGNGTFRGWLWTITHNRIRDHARVNGDKATAVGGSGVHAMLHSLPDVEPDDRADSDVSLADTVTYRALNTIRKEVQETTWLAFWRSTIDEIAPAAVADELEISIESVWQAKSRVLRRARQLLE